MTRAIQEYNCYFGQVFQKLWKYKCTLTTFGMGSYQIWPYHVTQAENFSFSHIKSYCPLNFRKSHKIRWYYSIPYGSYKVDNLKVDRSCLPPPPPNPCGIGCCHFSGLGGGCIDHI